MLPANGELDGEMRAYEQNFMFALNAPAVQSYAKIRYEYL